MNKEKRKNAEIKSLKTELNLFQAAGEALREECYTLEQKITELERQVQEYKDENVKLLEHNLMLYRALMKQRDEAEKTLQKCANNVWFMHLKERTY